MKLKLKLKNKLILLFLAFCFTVAVCNGQHAEDLNIEEINEENITVEPLVIYRETDGRLCKPYEAELEIITVDEPFSFEGLVLIQLQEDGTLKITSTDSIRKKYETTIEEGWFDE